MMASVRVFGTPVKAKASVLAEIIAIWAGVTWLGLRGHRELRIGEGLLIGFLSALLLLLAEFGHAIAHILSARYAGAPMDEVLVSGGMPRTLYWNSEVSPDAHRMRAMGGPIYNALGLLLSAVTYRVAPHHSTARELAGWSGLGHGLLLIGSLAPVSIVDGGTILKWTLVAKGKTPAKGDQVVRRIDWAMGIGGGLIGVRMIARRKLVPGLVSIGMGFVVTAIAAGKIR